MTKPYLVLYPNGNIYTRKLTLIGAKRLVEEKKELNLRIAYECIAGDHAIIQEPYVRR